MRRPHRSIETFDISLMAVVTKAMGAFLVLMLILLPGYDPNHESAADLMARLKAISAKIDELAKQLDDPGKGAADLRSNLGKIASEASLSAEVLGKLEALVDKAFANVQRLEAENQAKQREIDALNEELRKLRDKADASPSIVYVSGFAGPECNDTLISGVILKSGLEDGYTWLRDNKPIPPELLLHVSWQAKGGEVSATFTDASDKPYPDGPAFTRYGFITNAFLLMKNDVGLGEYVVVLFKKDQKRRWKHSGLEFPALKKSERECAVTINTAAKIEDSWNSDFPRAAMIAGSSFGGAFVAFTSDDEGIFFRAPTAEEHKWTASLFARALAAQNASPEGKLLLEEQKKKEEDARKAAEDARKSLVPPPPPPPPLSEEERPKQEEERLKKLNEMGK